MVHTENTSKYTIKASDNFIWSREDNSIQYDLERLNTIRLKNILQGRGMENILHLNWLITSPQSLSRRYDWTIPALAY